MRGRELNNRCLSIVRTLLVLSVFALVWGMACVNKSNSPQSDGSVVNESAKTSSDTGGTVDYTQMSPAEIVQYERANPRGFDLTNKKLLKVDYPPSGPWGDPYGEIIPYDCERQANNWDDLSVEEQMLGCGYEILDENGDSYEPRPRRVNIASRFEVGLLTFYQKHGRNPVNADEYLEWRISAIMTSPQPEGYEQYDVQEALDNLFSRLTSPVTGQLIEWDNPNFSPGNIYVRVVNDIPEAKKITDERHQRTLENHPEIKAKMDSGNYEDDVVYCVITRIFGKTGVIRSRFFDSINHTEEYAQMLKEKNAHLLKEFQESETALPAHPGD
ncbi:hypothetical protein J7K50_01910 [bacterium]|nr:hypothetical protein [bacterium]